MSPIDNDEECVMRPESDNIKDLQLSALYSLSILYKLKQKSKKKAVLIRLNIKIIFLQLYKKVVLTRATFKTPFLQLDKKSSFEQLLR